MLDVPENITCLLASFDLQQMDWENDNDRYQIVIEILVKGGPVEREWLSTMLPHDEVRTMLVARRGQYLDEEQRRQLRHEFAIPREQMPGRTFIE